MKNITIGDMLSLRLITNMVIVKNMLKNLIAGDIPAKVIRV